MIYVTHDQMETMALATKIIVFRGGVTELFGSPMELYETPRNMFVAQFIGSPKMSFFRANDLLSESGMHCGDEEVIGRRPEHLKLGSNSEGLVAGRLDLVERLGEYALAHITKDNGTEFVAKLERPPEERPGAELRFTASPEHIHAFSSENGQRLE